MTKKYKIYSNMFCEKLKKQFQEYVHMFEQFKAEIKAKNVSKSKELLKFLEDKDKDFDLLRLEFFRSHLVANLENEFKKEVVLSERYVLNERHVSDNDFLAKAILVNEAGNDGIPIARYKCNTLSKGFQMQINFYFYPDRKEEKIKIMFPVSIPSGRRGDEFTEDFNKIKDFCNKFLNEYLKANN